MTRVLLAVDLSNQLYKACHVHPTLEHEGVMTGGLFGFIAGVTAAILKTGATDVVVCYDVPPYERSKLYPEYKLWRKTQADPELKARVNEAKAMVTALCAVAGIPTWLVPGFESDDLIAQAVHVHGWRYDQVIAMSGDEDLYQLFWHPRFRMYVDAKSPLRDVRFMGYGLTPEQYVHALCLSGTHNDVEGLDGIGPVKSAEIVKNPVKWREAQAKHATMLDRNLQLIRLPHADFPRQSRMPTASRGRFDLRELYRFAGRYGINILPNMATAFEQVLM